MKKIVAIGGDAGNTRAWVSDPTGQIWRKSIELPYNGNTVYNPTIVHMDNRSLAELKL